MATTMWVDNDDNDLPRCFQRRLQVDVHFLPGLTHLMREFLTRSALFCDFRAVLLITTLLVCGAVSADEPVEFNRQIRPILAKNCFACHGLDASSRKADLRLDDRSIAM